MFSKKADALAMSNMQVYIVAMSINTMVQALGMHAENTQRLSLGYSVAYTEEDFLSLLRESRIYPDAIAEDLKIGRRK